MCNIGIENHPIKLDIKTICTLEIDLAKLFESNVKVANVAAPDAKIILHDTPFIQYKQFRLNDNFRQYSETSLLSKKVCLMGVKKTPLQKFYELGVELQSYTVDIVVENRQFDWLEIYLVYDNSEKHTTIYDSYNLECVGTFIQNVSIENVSNTNNVANKLKCDISDATENHMPFSRGIAMAA